MSDLLRSASQAIASCRGDRLVASFFGREEYQSWLQSPWYLIAVGKAAGAMAAGAHQFGGDALVAGLVIAKRGSTQWLRDVRVKEHQAGHPVPDASSFDAGDALLDFVVGLPSDARVLFCLSGGASSLVEVLPEDVSRDQWQVMTRQWLASGWDIARVNQERKRLSRIKGGRLLSLFPKQGEILQLAISDVAGDDLASIGSGLLAGDPEQRNLTSAVLANNQRLLSALTITLPNAHVESHFVTKSVEQLAHEIVRSSVQSGCYVWGGEPVVVLPNQVGRGGRMQHLALCVAWLLRDNASAWQLLAMGSDGSDGATEDAGALVDQDSIHLAQQQGWDIENVLHNFDAGRLLEDIGALITTGDTGTNVNDIVIFRCD